MRPCREVEGGAEERDRKRERDYRNQKQKPGLKSLETLLLEGETMSVGTNMEDLSIDQNRLPGVKEGKWRSDAATLETLLTSLACL